MCKILAFLFLFCIPAFGDTPSVLVSIAPYKFLVEQITKDTCQVLTVVTDHKDPHTYEFSPKHVEKLCRAQLWFRIGEGFEKACEKALTCEKVDLNQVVNVIFTHTSCAHQTFDTHTWLSPQNLIKQVIVIVDALCTHFPNHASFYRENGLQLIETLQKLDEEILKITEPVRQRHVLVAHGAFAYFCRDYHFIQHTMEKHAHTEPSLKDMLHIFEVIEKNNITSVILLRYSGKRSSTILAKRFHIRPIVLDPYEENVINNLRTIATTFAKL